MDAEACTVEGGHISFLVPKSHRQMFGIIVRIFLKSLEIVLGYTKAVTANATRNFSMREVVKRQNFRKLIDMYFEGLKIILINFVI